MLPAPFANALVLTGPTGSGKTRLGIELALRLNAEIVSMDSMAVYRRMDIGTAKPRAREREEVRHHLVDALEPWESASVAWWLRQAAACCLDIERRGKQILFVGGTPLYLKALCFGLFDGPPADTALRQRLQSEAETLGGAELHRRLTSVDPQAAARLHPNDLRRVIRALEVFELTGQPISASQSQWQKADVPPPHSPFLTPHSCSHASHSSPVLWLDLPRPVLYDRINRRVDEMFTAGLVEEVRALRELEHPLSSEAGQALGYKEVFAHLEGREDLAETIERVKTRSRNFAKRQITWFRHLPGCQSVTSQLTETIWHHRMKMS
jgi:tRNA dimethylallyltransferase